MTRTGPDRAKPHPISTLKPRVKIWLERDGHYAFGFGLCEMLQAVERAGSIKQAASELGKSYRYVWGRIKAAEEVLGQQLVETHVGGKGIQRSQLTPQARRLVAAFLTLREEMARVLRREFAFRFR
jgi:molybdate transport repressor ModE-like protein